MYLFNYFRFRPYSAKERELADHKIKRTDTGSYQPRKLRAAALPPHLYQDEASPRLHYLPLTCACFRLPCQSAKHGRVLMDRRNHDEDGCGPPGAVGVCAENGQFLSASFLISGALMCVERVSRGFDLGGTHKQTSGFGCSLVSVLCSLVTSSNSPSHRRLLSIWCVASPSDNHTTTGLRCPPIKA